MGGSLTESQQEPPRQGVTRTLNRVESVFDVAFVLGPTLGMVLLPSMAAALALVSRLRTMVVATCFVLATLAWLACFYLWGEGFTRANDPVDPGHIATAYDLAILGSALTNLLLLGTVSLSRRKQRRGSEPYAMTWPIRYGPPA
jgi:hypothetical protein